MRSLVIAVLATALSVVLYVRFHSTPDHSSEMVAFKDGDLLGGTLRARSFVVPVGAEVLVQEGLALIATDSIQILGRLRALDRGEDGPAEGPGIELVADREVEVTGKVLGGRGRSLDDGAPIGSLGGDGSSVILEAPSVVVDGLVRGGPGGTSGPGGKGGRGGSVLVFGHGWTREPALVSPQIVGGSGGGAGAFHPETLAGATGGDGGDALCHPWQGALASARSQSEHPRDTPEIHTAALFPWAQRGNNPPSVSLLDGTPGHPGYDTDNSGFWNLPAQPPPAETGTPTSPNGATGATGGVGLRAVGGSATKGGDGGSGCPDGQGGTGGTGGKGGDARGGPGGTGGWGGDAYHDGFGYLGIGGTGGRGGNGGGGIGGDAGAGGKGGKGEPSGPGGDPGRPGDGQGGSLGYGGPGGLGNPSGPPGAFGLQGDSLKGATKGKGAQGDGCGAE